MSSWTLRQVLALFIALLAVYFPVAIYLHYSYVPKDAPKSAILAAPFRKLDETAYQVLAPRLDGFADFDLEHTRSRVVLYEDGKPLGPPHSRAKIINGSYTHWRGAGIVFSASDNSDPNINGRTYSVTW